ncbi:PrsW family intramembrane metalloprotease [Streptacidiphilus sp. N1-12]|uniref:PrsW family intramembrane metalloprotease n=2 Tax=Streptacidiphilus alkalitolerans TaxID=3342712 RepID=A0ABV6WD90_9ACTN
MSSPQPDPANASANVPADDPAVLDRTRTETAGVEDMADLPVPRAEEEGPQFQLPRRLRYKPRRNPLESKVLRLTALIVLLALCGVAILALVQRQTGTSGLLIGISLAVLPVPLVLGAFYWLDRIEPKPLRNLLFCFAWGAFAATLVALLANTWATSLLIEHQIGSGETVGASVVAPLIEESAKGSAILLLFLFRRRDFSGIVDGMVYAGFTATGFAFTENILYIGRSVTEGERDGHGFALTVVTFILREVMSPFAHPLFTGMTGVGFGVAAMTRRRWLMVLAPIGGWVCAMFMHGTWNGSSALGGLGFLGVYFLFMVPVFGLMVWLVVWSRRSELLVVERQLPVYVAAGWLAPQVPLVLSTVRTRRQSKELARFVQGKDGARTMGEYLSFATSLAFLRQRAERGLAGADFTEREQELLHHLWERRERVAEVFVRVGAQEWYRKHPQPRRPYGYGYPQGPRPGYGPGRYPAAPGPYGQAPGPYPQPGPYAQPGAYAQPAPYAQPGPYARPTGYRTTGYPAPQPQAPAPYLPAQPQPGFRPPAYPGPQPLQPLPQQYRPAQPQPQQPLPQQPQHPEPADTTARTGSDGAE